jgi:hypothetical protein
MDDSPIIPRSGTALPTVKTAVDCTKPRRMSTGFGRLIYIQSDHPVYIWESDTVPGDYEPT